MAEEILLDDGKVPRVFTFEMGLIPPLYWTALKCRDARIRSKAFDLLKEAPAREGLWNREEALRVAAFLRTSKRVYIVELVFIGNISHCFVH